MYTCTCKLGALTTLHLSASFRRYETRLYFENTIVNAVSRLSILLPANNSTGCLKNFQHYTPFTMLTLHLSERLIKQPSHSLHLLYNKTCLQRNPKSPENVYVSDKFSLNTGMFYLRRTRYRSWLRHYATSRKVPDSSPDEVDFSIYLSLPAAPWPWGRLSL
jgi:hypothetical protein